MGIIMVETDNRGKRTHNSLDSTSVRLNKRGKVFSPFPMNEMSYSCGTCTSSDAFDQVRVKSPKSLTSGSAGDSVKPTADDYANLFFCEPSEEDELRAKLTQKEATPPSKSGSTRTNSFEPKRITTSRVVSFSSSKPTFHLLQNVPVAHAMSRDEKSTLWFSREELDGLKSSAQSSILDMRGRVMSSALEYKNRSIFRSMMLKMENETNSSIRGLEHRVLRRKQTRQMLIRSVIECQSHVSGLASFGHRLNVKEKYMLLSKVSRSRSITARSVALADAHDDYKEVYSDSNAVRVE
jgi:hypothetical protein